MDHFTRKTFATFRGFTYAYYIRTSPPQPDKPALLLQHGFPDDHNLWAAVLPYLLELDFPIVVPDLLGYNGTSKPTDAQAYNSKGMADDLAEILDHETIKHVISVGHDWGSYLAQRVALFYPDRVVGLILLNVAYMDANPFDAAETNRILNSETGLPRLAYQSLFVSEQAPSLLADHPEAAFATFHGSNEGTKNFMEDLFAHWGAMESFLGEDKRQPLKEYATAPGFKEKWIARFERDGWIGPLNWYHAIHSNIHWNVEKTIPEERFTLHIPVLFIGTTMDAVCLTAMIHDPTAKARLPNLTIEEIDSGHWQTYEVPEKTGPILVSWLKKRDGDFKPKA